MLFVFSACMGNVSAVNPQVTLQITGAATGTIVLELYPDKAPVTVANFLNYVNTGFYNGLIFHRVISGFMVQGGGYSTSLVKKATNPAIVNESLNRLSNLRGTIAMARTSEPHSATSEFFINHQNNLSLDYVPIIYDNSSPPNAYSKYNYCVFGKVISGIEVVDAIAALATTTENSMANVPVNDVIIQSATLTLNAPFCVEKLKGDIDGDCDVDTDDILKFAVQWLNPECKGCYSSDINGDGNVNFADYAAVAENWLKCNSITSTCD